MRIAYIIYPDVIISNRSNGIRSQAVTWANILTKYGHQIDFVNNWGDYDWRKYDVIHMFGRGDWVESVGTRMANINPNLVLSPIIDPPLHYNYPKNFILKYLNRMSKHLTKAPDFERRKRYIPYKRVLTRSDCESEFLIKAYYVPHEIISKVPLSYSLNCNASPLFEKEKFCLHISSIFMPHKNVLRLIEAAKKYNFKLVLAGNKGDELAYAPIKEAVASASNINVLGFISEEEKENLYSRAKVFALPSIVEGVGIVALDAALYGCEIVLSNIRGPKEYYNHQCFEVDPLDVDAIGKSIVAALDSPKSFQPALSEYVRANYSPNVIGEKLVQVYSSL